MKEIFAIENYKNFKGLNLFEIRRLTVLIGPNSSGKSSFIDCITQDTFNESDMNLEVRKTPKKSKLLNSWFYDLNNRFLVVTSMTKNGESSFASPPGEANSNEYIIDTENLNKDPDKVKNTITELLEFHRENLLERNALIKNQSLDEEQLKQLQKLNSQSFNLIVREDTITQFLLDSEYEQLGEQEPQVLSQEFIEKITSIYSIPYYGFDVFSDVQKSPKLSASKHFVIDFRTGEKRLQEILNSLENDFLKAHTFKGLKEETLKYFLKSFGIGEDYIIERVLIKSQPYYNLYIIQDGTKKELYQNFGFGIQSLIPILFSVLISDKGLICLEEPEAHLHPALQSKLADFIAVCITKYNMQFIVETHSEYFVRKLQLLIANQVHDKRNSDFRTIDSEDVIIYYFNDAENAKKRKEDYYKIEIEKNGALSRTFSTGFFDVSEDIGLNLLLINLNKN